MSTTIEIIQFISSFCSKCRYNSDLIQEILQSIAPEIKKRIIYNEVNIASLSHKDRELMNMYKPLSVPTLWIINDKKSVVLEGIIESNTILMVLADLVAEE
ncbi:MAG: hypothetical protein INQ03_15840 [Candidatus Heimdallarchaeota archaeon]|nr:hypothetical protein [Candidatus Heimdallarchaeota archaeon]